MNKFIDDLRDEHIRIKDFFSKLEALSSTRDYENRELLFAKLNDVLIPHLEAEENVLFAEVGSSGNLKDNILYYTEQHSIIKKYTSELNDRSKQADTWQAGIGVLEELVNMHIQKEESDYKNMISSINPERVGTVYEKYLQEESRVRKQIQDSRTMPY